MKFKYFFKKHIAPVLMVTVLCIFLIALGLNIYGENLQSADKLAYFGSIIGGGITLLGVMVTIDHSNHINEKQRKQHDKERKEELAIQYKPIPLIDFTLETEPFLDSDKDFLYFNLTITNVGRAEAIKLLIKNYYGKSLKFEHNYTDIAVKQITDFIFVIPTSHFDYKIIPIKNEPDIEELVATQYLTFEYYDIFNNRYEEVYQVDVTMEKDFSKLMQYSIEKVQ